MLIQYGYNGRSNETGFAVKFSINGKEKIFETPGFLPEGSVIVSLAHLMLVKGLCRAAAALVSATAFSLLIIIRGWQNPVYLLLAAATSLAFLFFFYRQLFSLYYISHELKQWHACEHKAVKLINNQEGINLANLKAQSPLSDSCGNTGVVKRSLFYAFSYLVLLATGNEYLIVSLLLLAFLFIFTPKTFPLMDKMVERHDPADRFFYRLEDKMNHWLGFTAISLRFQRLFLAVPTEKQYKATLELIKEVRAWLYSQV